MTNQNEFKNKISEYIEQGGADLKTLVAQFHSSSEDMQKNIIGRIDQMTDQLNVFSVCEVDDLQLSDDVKNLSEFKASEEFNQYKLKAVQYFLDGKYVPQFLFAGGATRLGKGPMYSLDLWEVVEEFGQIPPDHKAVRGFGMGPRQLLAYRQSLTDLANQNNTSVDDVITNQKMIININTDIESMIVDDLIQNQFYGFNAQNIYLIIQPTFAGYEMVNENDLIQNEKSPRLPYGHGHNAMQAKEKGVAFIIQDDRSKQYIDKSVIDVLGDGCVIKSHRINDLTKFSVKTVIEVDKLALELWAHDNGYNVTADLVANPSGAKGGNALKNSKTGKSFLLETLNAKGSDVLQALLDKASQEGAPYNAFRLTYHTSTIKPLLDFNFNLRFKDGYFYLESVTGDITQGPKANTLFYTNEELIHDFKSLDNISDAIGFLIEQDELLR